MTSTYAEASKLPDNAFESDIEVNAVLPNWSAFGGGGKRSLVRLLAHEIGHVLGFVHSCNDGTHPSGQLPACSALSAKEREAVMYPGASDDLHNPEPFPRLSSQELAELCRRFPDNRGATP